MERSDKIILITGATGRQGGAASRHVLADGWRVRALVRDPAKPAAAALADAGVELVVGDLLKPETLPPALDGCYGVYSMQTFREAGAEGEAAMGTALARAASEAGVEHFVQSSVIGADMPSELMWVKGKVTIEATIRDLGLPATIWRPATFMENFLGQRDSILAGILTGMEPPDHVHQWIAVDDIGRFVALAFREPERFIGVRTEIAGDELSWSDAARTFSRVLGTPVEYEQQAPAGGAAVSPDTPPARRADLARMREWIGTTVMLEQWVRESYLGA